MLRVDRRSISGQRRTGTWLAALSMLVTRLLACAPAPASLSPVTSVPASNAQPRATQPKRGDTLVFRRRPHNPPNIDPYLNVLWLDGKPTT